MGRQGTPRSDASKRLGAYASAHRQKRRWLQVLSALAAVVVFVTVYALVLPAATLTADVATMPEGAQVPEGYTHQYTASSDTDGYAVTVYAPDGAVPEGATLKADLLPEDGEKYAEAQQALAADAGEGSDYGFAAFDIRFEDAEGNEVEPTGDVYVVIDAADVIPEDADPASVTVQHLSEDETGAVAEVVTVADAADGTEGVVASGDDATLQAAFRVDGFSTYVITYTVESTAGESTTYERPVSVFLDGVELSADQLASILGGDAPSVSLTGTDWTTVTSLIPDTLQSDITVDGTVYKFDHASDESGNKITYVRNVSGDGSWLRYGRYADIVPSNDSNQVDVNNYIFSYPAGETLRLYFYSGDSPAVIPISDLADTSGTVEISLFDYNGKDISGVLNSSASLEPGERFLFVGEDSGNSENGDKPHYSDWTNEGGGVVQNIVQNTLVDYPVLKRTDNQSLAALFDPDNVNNAAFTGLNRLFTYDSSTGYYTFDSSMNFATINPTNGEMSTDDYSHSFTVYNRPNNGTTSGSTGTAYFMPFNEYGISDGYTSGNSSPNGENYHFGMTISMDFLMPKDGQVNDDDMVFSFSGDDDVWVYIDDVLILDMGGIHDSNSGYINFGDGIVYVDKVYYSSGEPQNNASQKRYIGDLLHAAKSSDTAWVEANLEQIDGHWYLKDYTSHKLKFFYLERGAVDSNCKIEFNLYTLQENSLYVGKDVTSSNTTSEEVQEWLGDLEYSFRVLDAETNNSFFNVGDTYQIVKNGVVTGSGTVGENGVFTLKAGEFALFEGISEDRGKFVVQEVFETSYSEQFGNVIVSVSGQGGSTKITKDGVTIGGYPFDGVTTSPLDPSVGTQTVVFNNVVDTDELSLLTITKEAAPGSTITGDEKFSIYVEIDGVPVSGTYSGVDFTDGTALIAVGKTGQIPVLTGSSFVVREDNGSQYNVAYSATQSFTGDIAGEYTLGNEIGGGVTGVVGDTGNTKGAASVTDATGATMNVTVTNSTYDTNVHLPILKNLDGVSDSSTDKYTFYFSVIQIVSEIDHSDLTVTTPGIEIVTPSIEIDTPEVIGGSGYAYINFNNVVDGIYFFKVSEIIPDELNGITYDTDYYVIKVTIDNGIATYEYVGRYSSEGIKYDESATTRAAERGLTFINSLNVALSVVKHESGMSSNTLPGAQFILYYEESDTPYYYVEETVNGVTTVTWSQNKSKATSLETDSNGSLTFHDLSTTRTYKLLETVAPDGYNLLEHEIQLNWDVDNTLKAQYVNATATGDITTDGNTVYVPNSTGQALPNTGGIGTTLMTVGGIALTALAGCGYGLRRSRERRGARS